MTEQGMTRDEAVKFQHDHNWKNICKEVQRMIVSETEKLIYCPVENCSEIQEKIKALQFLKNLPAIIAEREE